MYLTIHPWFANGGVIYRCLDEMVRQHQRSMDEKVNSTDYFSSKDGSYSQLPGGLHDSRSGPLTQVHAVSTSRRTA